MKRRISVLLLAGMLLLLTACGGVVRPPVRIGEATGNASFNRLYSLTEAFEEADVVALVQVGNWLGEIRMGSPIPITKPMRWNATRAISPPILH